MTLEKKADVGGAVLSYGRLGSLQPHGIERAQATTLRLAFPTEAVALPTAALRAGATGPNQTPRQALGCQQRRMQSRVGVSRLAGVAAEAAPAAAPGADAGAANDAGNASQSE